MTEKNKGPPDLLRGAIKLWIMHYRNRTPTDKELSDLVYKWNKMPHMPLKEFMQSEGL
jgi:hypothetical protein